ncbi:MAG: hypothetical protein KF774_13455 [Planctomyces sp.]|nr:hypothetical protein [Planctomyces sp.]
MAIQFDCPYCTATLRVHDAAANTIVRCSKCETRLRVPIVPIPQSVRDVPRAAARAAAAARPAEPADWESETITLPNRAAEVLASQLKAAASAPPPEEDADACGIAINVSAPPLIVTPVSPQAAAEAAYQRRQRRPNRGWIWVAGAFLLAAIGIGAGFWMQSQSNVVESLEGEVIAATSLTGFVSQKEVGLSDLEWSAIRAALEQRPAELRSPQMNLKFESAPRGLKVSLTPGKTGDLIAVPLLQTEGVGGFARKNPEVLRAPRIAALAAALKRMSARIQEATAAGRPPDLGDFGLSVGVTVLAGDLGFHCHAVIERNAFPCVFEDRDGRLYFLVPGGTDALTIRPRIAAETNVLPPRMQAQVKVPRATVVRKSEADAEPDSPPASDSGSDADPDVD